MEPERSTSRHTARGGAVQARADGSGADPYAWLLAALPARRAGRVLDLACGSAPLARGDRRALGRPRPLRRRARGRPRRPPGAHLVQGDARALPFAGPFDAVLASMALFLLAPLDRALAEVARVLVPGGTLAATVPDLVAGEDAALHGAVLADLGRTGWATRSRWSPGRWRL